MLNGPSLLEDDARTPAPAAAGGETGSPDVLAVTLPTSPAVEWVLADHLRYVREVERVEPTAAAVRRLRDDLLLQFHHGGRPVLCERTADGVVVLAAGVEAVFETVRRLPPDRRPGFAVEFPDPWPA